MKCPALLLTLVCSLVCAITDSLQAGEDLARSAISLDGPWQFRLDPKQEGGAAKWSESGVEFPNRIQVPGNWQAQGFGTPGGLRNMITRARPGIAGGFPFRPGG